MIKVNNEKKNASIWVEICHTHEKTNHPSYIVSDGQIGEKELTNVDFGSKIVLRRNIHVKIHSSMERGHLDSQSQSFLTKVNEVSRKQIFNQNPEF